MERPLWQAKGIEQLAKEVETGASRLELACRHFQLACRHWVTSPNPKNPRFVFGEGMKQRIIEQWQKRAPKWLFRVYVLKSFVFENRVLFKISFFSFLPWAFTRKVTIFRMFLELWPSKWKWSKLLTCQLLCWQQTSQQCIIFQVTTLQGWCGRIKERKLVFFIEISSDLKWLGPHFAVFLVSWPPKKGRATCQSLDPHLYIDPLQTVAGGTGWCWMRSNTRSWFGSRRGCEFQDFKDWIGSLQSRDWLDLIGSYKSRDWIWDRILKPKKKSQILGASRIRFWIMFFFQPESFHATFLGP